MVELDPADFTTDIDNPHWPMKPGTRWTYREVDPKGEALRVTVVVTTETREIANGITARVVRDTVFDGEEIVEDTFDWYAQDPTGRSGTSARTPPSSRTAKSSHARARSRRASTARCPASSSRPIRARDAYRQEYYAGEAEDNGEVLSTHAMADAPMGHFTDVLLTWDTNALEPEVAELKFYAPGVGPVLALEAAGGPGSREELITIDYVPEGTGTQPLGDPD